MRKKLIHEIK